MSEETTPKPAETEAAEKPAKAPKKEKPPALEDKPFEEFITQDFLPGLKQTLAKLGIADLDVQFDKRKMPIAALSSDTYSQVVGQMPGGKQFNIISRKTTSRLPSFLPGQTMGLSPR